MHQRGILPREGQDVTFVRTSGGADPGFDGFAISCGDGDGDGDGFACVGACGAAGVALPGAVGA